MKSRKQLLLLICFFIVVIAFAQTANQTVSINKATEKQLTTLEKVCDSLYKIEKIPQLDSVAIAAIHFTSPIDFGHLAKFYFYNAFAIESSSASDTAGTYQYKKSIFYAQQSGDVLCMVKAMGQMMDLLSPDKSSERFLLDSVAGAIKNIASTTKNDTVLVESSLYLSIYNKLVGDDGQSLKYALVALEAQKKAFQKQKASAEDVAKVYNAVCRSYRNMQQPEKEIIYLKEMRPYITADKSLLATYYLFMGENLFPTKNTGEAILYYDSLSQICQQNSNVEYWNQRLDMDLFFAQGFTKLGNYDKALLYATRANAIGKTWGYDYMQGNINFTNGIVYLARKDYPNALLFLKTAEPLAYARGYGALYQGCVNKIASCYAATGQWENAYQYSVKSMAITDSLTKINTQQQFAEVEAKYQTKEKQQQIVAQNTQLQFGHKQRLWLIVALALTALVALLLIVIYRSKKGTADLLDGKNKTLSQLNTDLEEANQTKAKLFGIISHELRSPIAQVYQFLKLQQQNPKLMDERQKQELGNKIQSATGSLLETMEDLLLWSKTQMSQFKVQKELVEILPIVLQCEDLLGLNLETKNITIKMNINPSDAIYTDPYYLQTILRNLLQNAIKASPENSMVEISFDEKNISISNDGIPFGQAQYEAALAHDDLSKGSSGLGLKLIDELAKKIGAIVNFKKSNDTKTVAHVVFG